MVLRQALTALAGHGRMHLPFALFSHVYVYLFRTIREDHAEQH